jgi:D-alanyl-D-alanine carboxypeptidase (penicillin-binding protein 5/6)
VLLLLLSILVSIWTVQAYREGRELDAQSARLTDPLGTPASQSGATPGSARPTPSIDYANLSLTAKAVYLLNLRTGETIYERDADEPLSPASTVKLVTALTALRYVRPEEVVTIQQEDVVNPAEESNMGLQVGDELTVHDLFVGLFLPSGNDAANALARVAGDRLPGEGTPMQRFVAEMNATAVILGMERTHVVNASGDDAEGQVMSASDLALAARTVIAEPALAPIVALPQAEVRLGGPNARVIELSNTNELIRTPGVFGVKTGTTPDAAECLVVAYRAPAGNEIAVVLHSTARYADARALLGLPEPTPTPSPTPDASPGSTP